MCSFFAFCTLARHIECPAMRIIYYFAMCPYGSQPSKDSCEAAVTIHYIRLRSYYRSAHLPDNFYHCQRIERLPHISNITGINTVFQFVEIDRMRANDRLLNSFLLQSWCKHLNIPLDTTCTLNYMCYLHSNLFFNSVNYSRSNFYLIILCSNQIPHVVIIIVAI